MAKKMPQFVQNLTMRFIDTAHWVQSEQPETLNLILSSWLVDLLEKLVAKL
jgi:hypothetical protein